MQAFSGVKPEAGLLPPLVSGCLLPAIHLEKESLQGRLTLGKKHISLMLTVFLYPETEKKLEERNVLMVPPSRHPSILKYWNIHSFSINVIIFTKPRFV
jgi:hypothetical protein